VLLLSSGIVGASAPVSYSGAAAAANPETQHGAEPPLGQPGGQAG